MADKRAAEIVVATILPERGPHGVQSHFRAFQDFLSSRSRVNRLVTPFSTSRPYILPVLRVRRVISWFSAAGSVWWHRRSNAHFLAAALESTRSPQASAVIYAQCPVSADVALRTRTNERVVLVVHFNVSQADEAAGSGRIRQGGTLYRSIQQFERQVMNRVDGIVYVSDFLRRQIEGRYPELARVPHVVVHNCVPHLDRPERSRDRDLITVGTLEPRKNQRYLLEVVAAAARLGSHYRLTVVGDGPDRAALEALATRLGIREQVDFAGYNPDPRALMAGHKAYCHTATMEAFGIVLLEAMSEGLPVLAGKVGGIPEIVRPEQDGAFWPLDDPAEAARVLIRLMTDDARRAAMGAQARSRVDEQFSDQASHSALLAFLDHVAELPQGVSAQAVQPVSGRAGCQ